MIYLQTLNVNVKKSIFFLVSCCFYFTSNAQNSDKEKLKLAYAKDTAYVWKLIEEGNKIELEKPKEAYKLYKNAEGISRKIGYKRGIVKAISNFTYILDLESKFDESKKYYFEALKIAREAKFLDLEASVLANIGSWYYRNGRYDSTMKFFTESSIIFDHLNKKEMKMTLKANMANLYVELKRYSEAIKIGNEIIIEKKSLKIEDMEVVQTLNNIGTSYFEQELWPPALETYQKAYQTAKRIKFKEGVMVSSANMANTYKNLKNFKESFNLSTESLQLAKELNDLQSISIAYSNIGNYYFTISQADSAYKYHKLAFDMVKSNNITAKQYDFYYNMANVSLLKGNVKDYLKFAEVADSLEVVLTGEKVQENAANIEGKYNLQKKETQIAKLELEKQRSKSFQYALLAGILAISTIGFIGYRNLAYRKKLTDQENLHLRQTQQLTATESIIKGQEEERSRLARDLHDGLGGLLSGIKLTLNNMTGNVILSEQNANVFTRALGQLDNAITEMRRVAHSMMPESLLKFGLVDAVNDFCEGISQSGKLKVYFLAIGTENMKLEQSEEITIYRIIQELLNNTLKHADATEAQVQIAKTEELLSITVEDNGKGFDSSQLNKNKGIGISNIENRVAYLNGKLEVRSELGKGTSTSIEIIQKS